MMGKRELVVLLCLSSWCLVIMWLFLTMPGVCLQFVIVVYLIILTIFEIVGLLVRASPETL